MRHRHSSLLALVLGLGATSGQAKDTPKPPPEVCQSKTINYITHTLPQQCLRTNWATANTTLQNSTAPVTETTANSATAAQTDAAAFGQGSTPTDASAKQSAAEKKDDASGDSKGIKEEDDDPEDLATSSFMSFEEWKAMMLQKSGQDPADLKGRKHQEGRDGPEGGQNDGLDTWGDDGEIALDFNVLSDKISEMTATAGARTGAPSGDAPNPEGQEPAASGDGVAHYRRPKDAGKTCKERFSYSSFDGGATVLKTSPGVKNAKAILVENKDSYMLFTCSHENKFVIVELSEDILVDTVVLANFEFFSSMIRSFRISVSDKYPVKMEKWKDLGTFQARNSRDIQSFLVENPKIWAKYIRIEFLSHYGNEYYCPVSLLRVHGTRMLDSWKDAEAGVDDDEPAETISSPEAAPEPEVHQENDTIPEAKSTSVPEHDAVSALNESVGAYETSPWYAPLSKETYLDNVCKVGTPTTPMAKQITPLVYVANDSSLPAQAVPSTDDIKDTVAGSQSTPSTVAPGSSVTTSSSPAAKVTNDSTASTSTTAIPSNEAVVNKTQTIPRPIKSSMTPPKSPSPPRAGDSSTSKSSTKQSTNNQNKTSSATTSSTASTPTVQESFFKSISKRLQFLESNTTLSLQYIEDQSKFLQEALQKMERRQISRVDAFLTNLNNTVLSELHNVRQQYDQIWQSTVLALETQREQSQREIIALSSRLNLLADEVVFQKRMAIFQSVLLLCCLILVLFSRGVLGGGAGSAGGGTAGSVGDQWTMAATSQFINSFYNLGSPRWPPGSPVSGSRGNTPKHSQHHIPPRLSGGGGGNSNSVNIARRTSGANLHPNNIQRSVSGPLSSVHASNVTSYSRSQSYTDKMLPLTPTSDTFDDSSENTPTPPATVPTTTTAASRPPRIHVAQPSTVPTNLDPDLGTHKDTHLYKDCNNSSGSHRITTSFYNHQQIIPREEDEEEEHENVSSDSVTSSPEQKERSSNSTRRITRTETLEDGGGIGHVSSSYSSGEDSSASATTVVDQGEGLRTGSAEDEHEQEEDIGDDDIWATASPSKPPLTRSPLSELGGNIRKPLPALPEDPT